MSGMEGLKTETFASTVKGEVARKNTKAHSVLFILWEPMSSAVAVVKDAFEIKPQHNTGHAIGVIAVLNGLLSKSFEELVGLVVVIRRPDGTMLQAKVDDARNHDSANSLFFKSLTTFDVPVGSRIQLQRDSA